MKTSEHIKNHIYALNCELAQAIKKRDEMKSIYYGPGDNAFISKNAALVNAEIMQERVNVLQDSIKRFELVLMHLKCY